MDSDFIVKIKDIVGREKVKENELMSKHTTFRIGGPADVFVESDKVEELVEIVKLSRKSNFPVFVFGGGSNILVGDKGVRGLIIHFKSQKYWLGDSELEVSAGMGTAKIALEMVQKGLSTGLEYFATVPGTIGGAVYNNSHWKDKLIGDFLVKARILDSLNEIREVEKDYFKFKYDYSFLQDSKDILLTASFEVKEGDKKAMQKMIIENNKARSGQPLEEKCAGCTFKNPSKEQPAGLLIDQCGLKGKKIAGAQISTKHANFIINIGTATALDVAGLIELCKKEVGEKFGIELKEEIQLVGEF